MHTVLIARFKNKKEASKAAKMLKAIGSQSIVSVDEDIEDKYLSELIDEGIQEKGDISQEEFDKYLDEKIAAAEK